MATDADKEFCRDFLKKVLKDSGVSCRIKEESRMLEITVRENRNVKYYILSELRNRGCKTSCTGGRG